MDQASNLTAAFVALWNRAGLSAGPSSLVPGGIQWSAGHQKPPAARPYAQVWASLSGSPEWTSGLNYCQNYRMAITVWCGDDNTVLKAVDAALDALIGITTKLETTGFLTESAKTVHITISPGGLDQEESRANQQQVGIVQRVWNVLLNQTRITT